MEKTIFQTLTQKLFDETDGNKFSKLKNKLIKNYSITERVSVITVLTQYIKEGKLIHWREFLLNDLIEMATENEPAHISFFEWAITVPSLTYWSIDGLLKTALTACYPQLVILIKAETQPTEIRAKAIKSIAIYSRQPFDRNLPEDPSYWKTEELRINEIMQWEKDGYPDGSGYPAPKTHPSLKKPTTDFEKIVSRLDKKLQLLRNKDQDLSNPSNWLVIADETDISDIKQSWSLPETYLFFLQNYSPIKVFISGKKFVEGLQLYGADTLVKNQQGYMINPVTGKILKDWPKQFVVIGDDAGDPFCIDLSQISNNDAPVYTSIHGQGYWEFQKHSHSFTEFLKEIAAR